MSSYFQGQNYTINELPSNADPLTTALTAFATIKKQKLDNRNATLNNVLDNATIFANKKMDLASSGTGLGESKYLDFLNKTALDENGNVKTDAAGNIVMKDGTTTTFEQAYRQTGASPQMLRATSQNANPYYRQGRNNQGLTVDQKILDTDPNNPIVQAGYGTKVVNRFTPPTQVVSVNQPQQEAIPASSTTNISSQVDSQAEPTTATQTPAPVRYTPGKPLTGGVSAEPVASATSFSSTPAQDSGYQWGAKPRADLTAVEQQNTLRGGEVDVMKNLSDRVGYDSSGKPVVKFDGQPSNIPLDEQTQKYVRAGQNLALSGSSGRDRYLKNQEAARNSAEKYRQFLGHIDNIEQTVNKYGDLQPLYNAISTADLAGGGKYIEQIAATRYPGMNPAELRSLTSSIQALKSYRPTFAKDAGDVGNFSQSEQDVFNYLADAGKYLDPNSIQILKQTVYDKIGNPMYMNGVAYGESDAANLGYQLRQAAPSLSKPANYQLQNIAPITTRTMQQAPNNQQPTQDAYKKTIQRINRY